MTTVRNMQPAWLFHFAECGELIEKHLLHIVMMLLKYAIKTLPNLILIFAKCLTFCK